MGTSFISINDKGFWIQDDVLELWLRLLALHIEESPDGDIIGRNIRDRWLLASRGYFGGSIPDGVEDAVATDEGRAVVLRAINSLMAALKNAPERLHHGTLNILGREGKSFIEDFDTSRLIEVGDAFLDLIAGKIQSDVTSTDFMPGSRNT